MAAPLTNEDKAFLRAILEHPDELTTWLVYADWLDDRGDPRAEFLRLTVERSQIDAQDSDAVQIDARLAILREALDPHWMLAFDTPRLSNCNGARWLLRCPVAWDQLSATDEPDIRICHSCNSPVFYCHSPDEARLFASSGQCVALSTRVRDEDNPFLEREEVVAGMFDSDEYPLPQAGAQEIEIEVPDLAAHLGNDDNAQRDAPTPSTRRPWWRFW